MESGSPSHFNERGAFSPCDLGAEREGVVGDWLWVTGDWIDNNRDCSESEADLLTCLIFFAKLPIKIAPNCRFYFEEYN